MKTFRSILRPLSSAGLSLFVLLVLSVSGLSQSNKADIVGTIKDSSGAAIPGAKVTITKVDTTAERIVTTTDDGNYTAPFFDMGTYKISVTKQGYRTSSQDGVALQTSDRLRVDIELKPGDVTGEVTITAAAPLV